MASRASDELSGGMTAAWRPQGYAVPVTHGRARSSLHKQTTLARPTSTTCHAHGHAGTRPHGTAPLLPTEHSCVGRMTIPYCSS